MQNSKESPVRGTAKRHPDDNEDFTPDDELESVIKLETGRPVARSIGFQEKRAPTVDTIGLRQILDCTFELENVSFCYPVGGPSEAQRISFSLNQGNPLRSEQ